MQTEQPRILEVCWRGSGWDSGMNWKGLDWRARADCGPGYVKFCAKRCPDRGTKQLNIWL